MQWITHDIIHGESHNNQKDLNSDQQCREREPLFWLWPLNNNKLHWQVFPETIGYTHI